MIRMKTAMLMLSVTLGASPVRADEAVRMLVLPLRTLGVDEQTAHVSRELLAGSLADLGLEVTSSAPDAEPPPSGAGACDETACAIELGRRHGATQVVYGSMSRLGTKIIVRLSVLRVDESVPYYRDQLTATAEEDLDKVMRRFAEGIASGRPNSDRASVESVTQAEAITPARRATRGSFGLRAGFLFPTGGSYAGEDRLTHLHLAHVYDLGNVLVETTPVLGFGFGDRSRDWTLLDLSILRPFGDGDTTPYLGGGIGVHSIAYDRPVTYTSPSLPPYTYAVRTSETVPTVHATAGLMALRTYDFSLFFELRLQHAFTTEAKLGRAGDTGVRLTFGTGRSESVRSRPHARPRRANERSITD